MITSRTNPLIKTFRKLKGKLPGTSRNVFIEGIRMIEEGLKSGTDFEALFFTPKAEASPRARGLLERLRPGVSRFSPVSEEVMASLSAEESPPGILALIRVSEIPLSTVPARLLVLCGVRDPGNAGSLLRSAEGSGFSAWFSEDAVHPLHPKVVKASMGSAFRVPIGRGEVTGFLKRMKEKKLKLVGTRSGEGIPYDAWSWEEPFALLLGGEAEGMPGEMENFLDGTVTIPLRGGVESLNVAAAGAILMFEAARGIGG